MKLVYVLENIDINDKKSIFLAGPTIRIGNKNNTIDLQSWRKEAVDILKSEGFNGSVYIPEWDYNIKPKGWTYKGQIDWETNGLNSATIILFWIPRNNTSLPGFTTNVEFGEWYKSGKIVVGSPKDSWKNEYLQFKSKEQNIDWKYDLRSLVKEALLKINSK